MISFEFQRYCFLLEHKNKGWFLSQTGYYGLLVFLFFFKEWILFVFNPQSVIGACLEFEFLTVWVIAICRNVTEVKIKESLIIIAFLIKF